MGLIKPIFFNAAKHIFKLIFDENYRNFSLLSTRIGIWPRFKECKLSINGFKIRVPDNASFLSAYKEIFVDRIYCFRSSDAFPTILDLGANVGVSVMFFKSLYPKCKIIAVEADPKIFGYLQENISTNNFSDVTLINKAAWFKEEILNFSCDNADGGSICNGGNGSTIEIPTIDVAEIMSVSKIDYLKMDIEGAEDVVLPACIPYLNSVRHIFIEYHSKKDEKQSLGKIINIIENAGFRIHINCVMTTKSPFMGRNTNGNFDMQLNIFGWKDETS